MAIFHATSCLYYFLHFIFLISLQNDFLQFSEYATYLKYVYGSTSMVLILLLVTKLFFFPRVGSNLSRLIEAEKELKAKTLPTRNAD